VCVCVCARTCVCVCVCARTCVWCGVHVCYALYSVIIVTQCVLCGSVINPGVLTPLECLL